jgi:hypothetical protein
MMEAVRTSETSVDNHFTRQYIPEDNSEQEFYSLLNNVLDDTDMKDAMILMGDFNAKVGCNNEEVEHGMGTHGIGDRNENGELLIERGGRYNLKIGKTLFAHKLCHKVAWVSPNSNIQN